MSERAMAEQIAEVRTAVAGADFEEEVAVSADALAGLLATYDAQRDLVEEQVAALVDVRMLLDEETARFKRTDDCLTAILPLARAAAVWWRADDATLAEAHGRLLTALADLDPGLRAELEERDE